MSGSGPSPSNTNSTPTPSTSTRSRLLLLSQATPTSNTSTTTIIANTPKGSTNQFPVVDEKLFTRYSNTILAESHRRKTEHADHMKRLAVLRKEVEYLEHTDWMYEPVEKLWGK